MTTTWVLPALTCALTAAVPGLSGAVLPRLDAEFNRASARSEGDTLVVSTGTIERRWTWTGHGLVTTGLKHLQSGKIWATAPSAYGTDWSHPGLLPDDARAEVLSLSARQNDDEGFTSRHLEVVAEIHYPDQRLTVKQTIWAYPGADGLRQQLWVKGGGAAAAVTRPGDPPAFTVLEGTPYTNPAALEVRPKWEASTLSDARTVSLRIANVDRDRRYVVGLSWWDFGNGGRRQSVEVATVDGETTRIVVKEAPLPGWVKDKQPAQSLTFELPREVNADGTVTLNVRKHAVASATVSELWVYEYGAKAVGAPLEIDPARRRQLDAAAPAGAALVAYLGAGGVPQASQAGNGQGAGGGRVDYLPVDTVGMALSAAGYYSDTQHRNSASTPVLRQASLPVEGECAWANLLFIEDGGDGLTLVKESHKTVQTPGVDTGLFRFGKAGVENTGWCLTGSDLVPDEYKWLWGSWVLTHAAGQDAREQAVKAFDRLRFPTRKARDMWTVMCTWGHSKRGDGRTYAYEEQVLHELPICAELGIDMLLIDDGWQQPKDKALLEDRGWKPHPDIYPTKDWRNVVARAGALHMRLGLWAAYSISTDDLVWNRERLGQEQQKLDFANLRSHAQIEAMRQKARQFMQRTGQKCIVSWDTTEAAPRYGYYLFREYGNVHFMNRKPEEPGNVLYTPWLALRDFWQLSHYQNLNKWQLVIQNPEVVVKEAPDRQGRIFTSDAWKHGVDYCIATALMGTPEFMAVTRFYSDEAKAIIRPLLARYKTVRGDIWDSFVYPIGDPPSNRSWTGFQAVHPQKNIGFLTVFREVENEVSSGAVALRHLAPGTRLVLEDLRSGRTWTATLDEHKQIALTISKAPGFVFLKYSR